jgi:hypothetical protein
MVIAAHLVAPNAQLSVLYNCLLQLAKEKPSDSFIFLMEDKWNPENDLPGNIKMIPVSPALKNGLLMHYWYNFKLPALLKKNKVTHFISASGACSIKSKVAQFILISNISFLQRKPLFAQAHSAYLKRFFPKFLQSASAVLITENFIGAHIIQKYPAAKDKLRFIGHGLSQNYAPVSWEQKEKMLEQFTAGTEYFISECSPITKTNLLLLLKAFSLFKKRQKSGLQLMLMMKGVKIEDAVKDFHLYKYRQDVKIIPESNEEEDAGRWASAYAAIHLPQQVIAENTGLNALQAGIPLITIEDPDAVAVYGPAALYSTLSEKAIAENMMLLYKDETVRNDYIKKGKEVSITYNWASASASLRKILNEETAIKS